MPIPEPLERLVSLLKKLPGVGEKSARRMAFYILQQPEQYSESLAISLRKLREILHPCPLCGNITDEDPCAICRDPLRDRKFLCIVESPEDLISMEQAGIYDGLYHVLGSRVSPLEGKDVSQESILNLIGRINALNVEEVIVATNPRIEGDMTYYALIDAFHNLDVKVTRLSYGLPVGGSIEFADRVTLHAALESRIEIKSARDERGD